MKKLIKLAAETSESKVAESQQSEKMEQTWGASRLPDWAKQKQETCRQQYLQKCSPSRTTVWWRSSLDDSRLNDFSGVNQGLRCKWYTWCTWPKALKQEPVSWECTGLLRRLICRRNLPKTNENNNSTPNQQKTDQPTKQKPKPQS